MEKLNYEWTITYRYDDPPVQRFNEQELETLRYLGDRGLLFVCSYPGCSLNFGLRLEGAQGPLPFVGPTKDGDYIGYVSITESEDRIAILDAQRWSILEAYKLGFEDGRNSNPLSQSKDS